MPFPLLAPLSLLPLLLSLPAGSASGQVPTVLQLPATVRSAGFMGAGAALMGDAGAVFTNPAALATIRHVGIEAGYRRLPGERAFATTAAVAWRLPQIDLGMGLRWFDLGTDPARYLDSASAPGTPASELLAVGSLVYRFAAIALGGSGKYVQRTVGGSRERGVTADAGFAVAFFDIMALTFSMQNIRGNWYEASPLALPRLTRFGFTMNYVDPQETFRLLSVAEVQWPAGEATRVVVGGEAGVVFQGIGVVGRLGVGSRGAAGGSAFSYGASLALTHLQVDYGYRGADLLGQPAHQIGLRLTL